VISGIMPGPGHGLRFRPDRVACKGLNPKGKTR
jgi:hypothetical protein